MPNLRKRLGWNGEIWRILILTVYFDWSNSTRTGCAGVVKFATLYCHDTLSLQDGNGDYKSINQSHSFLYRQYVASEWEARSRTVTSLSPMCKESLTHLLNSYTSVSRSRRGIGLWTRLVNQSTPDLFHGRPALCRPKLLETYVLVFFKARFISISLFYDCLNFFIVTMCGE